MRLLPEDLGRWLRFSAASLLLPLSWNYKTFQGLGCLWLLRGQLRYPATVQQKEPLQPFAGYFNTNVFLAPAVLAAAVRLYEERLSGQSTLMAPEAFLRAVMAPVAAVGDALFWGGLRPLVFCAALLLAWLGWPGWPLVVLAGFILPTLLVRLLGSLQGYGRGHQVVMLLQHLRLADLAIRCKQATLVLLGAGCALLLHQLELANGLLIWLVPLLFAALIPLLALVLRRGISLVLLWWLALLLLILFLPEAVPPLSQWGN
ncbi:PTS system mannose/fructose/sorbose family transporter subunit IID [Desulfuromonas thiophila]|uniref:PTS system IID component, Man family n=1 Tax=Desulfuromonas thiophila TaxID=57664 RepID=A0A1G7ASU5_9BACT|nr:PTS system mannose/fructose/sorbose family transporter subunit IID [Desulfuromonas thiophila]SDE17065.1 PTS system IID component, Man family [Desulfuromonas thiophila]